MWRVRWALPSQGFCYSSGCQADIAMLIYNSWGCLPNLPTTEQDLFALWSAQTSCFVVSPGAAAGQNKGQAACQDRRHWDVFTPQLIGWFGFGMSRGGRWKGQRWFMLSSEAWQCLVAMGIELVGEGSLAALEGTAALLHWPWNATLGRGN